MYEYLGQFKPVYTMELPNAQSPAGLELWTKEIIKLKEKLESFFEVTITEEQVREQVKIMNNVRRAMKEFYSLTLPEPVPVLGQDLFKVLYGSSFKFDKKRLPEEVHAICEKIRAEYQENPNKYPKAPRILVTGCQSAAALPNASKLSRITAVMLLSLKTAAVQNPSTVWSMRTHRIFTVQSPSVT